MSEATVGKVINLEVYRVSKIVKRMQGLRQTVVAILANGSESRAALQDAFRPGDALRRQVVEVIPMSRPGWKTVIYSTGEAVLLDPNDRIEAFSAPWL